MGKALDVLPLVEVLWRRERDLEAVDTPERQAGLEQVVAGREHHSKWRR